MASTNPTDDSISATPNGTEIHLLPESPDSIASLIDAADIRLAAAERLRANANLAVRRFDRYHVFSQLQELPPGEKTAPVERDGAPKRGRFYVKQAIDYGMCINARLHRVAAVFSYPDPGRYAEKAAKDLRKAARRLERMIGRDPARLLDDCHLNDPVWLRAKEVLLAAIRRESLEKFAELLEVNSRRRSSQERFGQLWINWFHA